MVYIKKVPRKDLLVFGGICCTVSLYFIALFDYLESPLGSIVCILVYRVVYAVSVSAGTWPYCNEIVSADKIYIPFTSHWIMIAIVVFMFPIIDDIFTTKFVFILFA